jgi:NAD(P)-dependent dehydrogenase (short-subunit alcohol dehydrogenase family)
MDAARDLGPVLITGCSSGLGYATALKFRKAGYLTVATARKIETLAPLAALGCRTLPLDVTDEASRVAAIATVEKDYGAVGVLVNSAGYGQCRRGEITRHGERKMQFVGCIFAHSGSDLVARRVSPSRRIQTGRPEENPVERVARLHRVQ